MKKRMFAAGVIILAAGYFCAAQTAGTAKYKVVEGDTLWSLSGKYYGDPFKWNKIYDANKDVIKDPHWIYPEWELVIPVISVGAIHKRIHHMPDISAGAAVTEQAEKVVSESSAPFKEEAPSGMAQQPALKSGDNAEAVKPSSYDPAKEQILSQASGRGMKETLVKAPQYGIADEMPVDMTWGFPSAETKLVPLDWHEDGIIVAADPDDPEDDLAGEGDYVDIKLTQKAALKTGELMFAYRRGNIAKDKKGRKIGLELEKSAVLKIIKIDGSKLRAQIVRVYNPVEKEDVVKKD